jgi:Bacterial SH3 domain
MQLARLVAGVGIVWAGTALAAQGDALLVSGSNVNVRAGPGAEAGILTRVGANEPAIERRRQGQWVEVELPGQDVLGWIHDSLLITAPEPAGAPPPGASAGEVAAAAPPPSAPAGEVAAVSFGASDAAAGDALQVEESDGTPLSRFRSEVAYFNNRAVAAAGVDLFTGVAPLGEDGVQVVTTEAWATMPQPGQQSYLNALFGRWQAAAGTDRALRLEIIDASGALMMETSGP